jgi:signal transduction histidine kinase
VERQFNVRLEERLAERTRIAQELHDTLLQGFVSASMHLDVAAGSLPADSKAKPMLTRTRELMRQVIDEGRNAVRGLRSHGTPSLDLEQAFSQVFHEHAANPSTCEPVGFRVMIEGQQKPLNPLLRDEVYRIGREALINAFRHSHAKQIEVAIKYSPASCVLWCGTTAAEWIRGHLRRGATGTGDFPVCGNERTESALVCIFAAAPGQAQRSNSPYRAILHF